MGLWAVCSIMAHQSSTMVVMIIYCVHYEGLYLSLSDVIFIFKDRQHCVATDLQYSRLSLT